MDRLCLVACRLAHFFCRAARRSRKSDFHIHALKNIDKCFHYRGFTRSGTTGQEHDSALKRADDCFFLQGSVAYTVCALFLFDKEFRVRQAYSGTDLVEKIKLFRDICLTIVGI